MVIDENSRALPSSAYLTSVVEQFILEDVACWILKYWHHLITQCPHSVDERCRSALSTVRVNILVYTACMVAQSTSVFLWLVLLCEGGFGNSDCAIAFCSTGRFTHLRVGSMKSLLSFSWGLSKTMFSKAWLQWEEWLDMWQQQKLR